MTLSIADRFSRAQVSSYSFILFILLFFFSKKIRVLPVVEKDPESRRSEMIKVIFSMSLSSSLTHFIAVGRREEIKGVN